MQKYLGNALVLALECTAAAAVRCRIVAPASSRSRSSPPVSVTYFDLDACSARKLCNRLSAAAILASFSSLSLFARSSPSTYF